MREVLICGYGSIGRQYYRSISQETNFNLSVLTRQELNLTNFYKMSELPLKKYFDLVIIANQTKDHIPTFLNLLNNSNTFLFEKPLTSSTENAQQSLNDLLSREIFVSAPLRFRSGYRYLLNNIKSIKNQISKVEISCISWLPNWRPGRNFQKGYWADPEQGGVLRDLIHEFDYILSIFGAPIKISGETKSNPLLGNKKVETFSSTKLIYDSFELNITLDYFSKVEKRFARIYFRDGTYLHWNVLTDKFSKHDSKSNSSIDEIYTTNSEISYLAKQVTAIFSNDMKPPKMLEAINNLVVIDAARSCNKRKTFEFLGINNSGIWEYR
jgi:predicted dehydrogenase